MKKFIAFLFLCFLFLNTTSFAQTITKSELKHHQLQKRDSKKYGTVISSLDTIFNAGEPYAIIKQKSRGVLYEYFIYSLTNKKLINIITECKTTGIFGMNEFCYKVFLFIAEDKRVEMRNNFLGVSVAALIADNDLIKDNAIDPIALNRFSAKYPVLFSTTPDNTIGQIIDETIGNIGRNPNTSQAQNNNTANDNKAMERNRSLPILIFGNEVQQDGKSIAKIHSSSEAQAGKILNKVSIYSTNGAMIAEAIQVEINSLNYKMTTIKDNKLHTVTVSFLDAAAKDLIKFLSDSYYL